MKQRFLESLQILCPKDCGDYIEIELPVVLYFADILLTLRIYPLGEDKGYYVLDDGAAFSDFSHDTEYYFNMFEQDDQHYHFRIGVSDQCFFKQYDTDFNVRVAIDEFVRFFIYLDDYIGENPAKVYGIFDDDNSGDGSAE